MENNNAFENIYKYKMKNNINCYNIILCSDNNIADVLFVIINSISKNLKRKVKLWILQSDYTESVKNELTNYCKKLNIDINIIYININKYYGFNQTRIPLQAYFYLDAHNILDRDIDRALYIDMDTLILKDIGNFYDIDFDDAYLVAGNEYSHIKLKQHIDLINRKINGEDIPQRKEFIFNSGVLLLNLEKFRNENITIDNYKNLLEENDIGKGFHDQVLINRLVRDKLKIAPRWNYNSVPVCCNYYINCMNKDKSKVNEVYQYNTIDDKEKDTIIHYCGKDCVKPWKVDVHISPLGDITINNNRAPQQNRYLKIWWEYAQNIPGHIFKRLYKKNNLDIRPHMKADEIYLYSKIMSNCKNYLEFGLGGSTIFALNNFNFDKMTCIELNEIKVQRLVNDNKILKDAIDTEKLALININIGSVNNLGYQLERDNYKSLEYTINLWKNLKKTFDVCLIDGRYRLATALLALVNLKECLFMFHDFNDRYYYHKLKNYIEIIDNVKTLIVYKAKTNIDMLELYNDLYTYIFDAR